MFLGKLEDRVHTGGNLRLDVLLAVSLYAHHYSDILPLLEPSSGQIWIAVVVSLPINTWQQLYDKPRILVAVEPGKNHAVHAFSRSIDLSIT